MSEENILKELVIKRSEWMTPTNKERINTICSKLYLHGLKCCLGFACLALGATEKEIENQTFPITLKENHRFLQFIQIGSDESPKFHMRNIGNNFAFQAAQINDDKCITDTQRESDLITLFGEHNITLSFVD